MLASRPRSGRLIERSLPASPHGEWQTLVAALLAMHERTEHVAEFQVLECPRACLPNAERLVAELSLEDYVELIPI